MSIDKYIFNKDPYNDINEFCFSIDWSLGGSYGNCWDNELRNTEGDIEPEFKELDNFLLELCPNISYLQYKKIESKIQYKEKSTSDYYGGRMVRAIKYITKKDLEDVLDELGLLS